MTWAVYVACMGDSGVAFSILVGKPEGKRPLGRSRHRWEDNIKTYIQDVVWGGMDCSGWI